MAALYWLIGVASVFLLQRMGVLLYPRQEKISAPSVCIQRADGDRQLFPFLFYEQGNGCVFIE